MSDDNFPFKEVQLILSLFLWLLCGLVFVSTITLVALIVMMVVA